MDAIWWLWPLPHVVCLCDVVNSLVCECVRCCCFCWLLMSDKNRPDIFFSSLLSYISHRGASCEISFWRVNEPFDTNEQPEPYPPFMPHAAAKHATDNTCHINQCGQRHSLWLGSLINYQATRKIKNLPMKKWSIER